MWCFVALSAGRILVPKLVYLFHRLLRTDHYVVMYKCQGEKWVTEPLMSADRVCLKRRHQSGWWPTDWTNSRLQQQRRSGWNSDELLSEALLCCYGLELFSASWHIPYSTYRWAAMTYRRTMLVTSRLHSLQASLCIAVCLDVRPVRPCYSRMDCQKTFNFM